MSCECLCSPSHSFICSPVVLFFGFSFSSDMGAVGGGAWPSLGRSGRRPGHRCVLLEKSRRNDIYEGSEAGLLVCRGETRSDELGLRGEREAGHPVWSPELMEGSGALAQNSRMLPADVQ